MKLRQKLAMVLASAMIVTAIPVTTMAASSNSLTKTVSLVKGQNISTNSGLDLIVDYKDTVTKGDVFYVEATDFKFTEKAYGKDVKHDLMDGATKIGTVERLSDSELEVVILATASVDKVYVPIGGEVQEGTPTVTVTGTDTFATTGTAHVLGGEVTSDKLLVATAGDAKNITVEGEGQLAEIVIEEKAAGSTAGKVVEVKLPNSSDVVFGDITNITVEGSKGLGAIAAGTAVTVSHNDPSTTDTETDEKVIYVTLPSTVSTRTGSIKITGIEVLPEDKKEDIGLGDITVTVSADKMDEAKLTVGKVVEEGATIKVDEVKTLTAGHGKETVKVVVEEAIKDSMTKPVYFTIEEGKFVGFKDATAANAAGFTINAKNDEITFDPTVKSDTKYEVEIEIKAEASKAGETVVILAEGRDLADDIEMEAAEVEAAFTVEADTFNLETGVKGQKGGEIVITEVKEDKLGRGQQIVIVSEDEDIQIEDAEVEVTEGDLELEDAKFEDGRMILTVKRNSDEASEITITDIEITTDKNVAEGNYDFYVGGTAVSEANVKVADEDMDADPKKDVFADKITLESFVATGDAAEATQAEVVLQVGNASYTVDGEAATAEIAPFIDPATNRTMAPVRAVAEAFGCELDFFFPQGSDQLVITMTKGDTRVQFQNGSNIMVVNGGQFIMSATAQIKDGHTFVPVAFLAQALNIEYTWDGATQTIVFGN